MSFSNLPKELIPLIGKNLSYCELRRLMKTCKPYYNLLKGLIEEKKKSLNWVCVIWYRQYGCIHQSIVYPDDKIVHRQAMEFIDKEWGKCNKKTRDVCKRQSFNLGPYFRFFSQKERKCTVHLHHTQLIYHVYNITFTDEKFSWPEKTERSTSVKCVDTDLFRPHLQ